jgi:hypothetical protein
VLTLLLGLLVLVLTSFEVWAGNQHVGARLLARKTRAFTDRLASANRAAIFEALLCVWLFLSLEDKRLLLLAIPGAWIGDFLDTRPGRKRRKRKPKLADAHGIQ